MGFLFLALVAVLWLCLVIVALRRRRTIHALAAVAAAGIPVLGGFLGNWACTGSNPGDELSHFCIACGCCVGLGSFLIVLAIIALDLQRRGTEPAEKP